MATEDRVPGEWNTEIEQNATWSRQCVYADSEGANPDFTGYTVEMQIRQTIDSGSIIVTPTITYTDLANATWVVSLTAAQTKELRFSGDQKAEHDLFLINGSVRTKIMYGTVNLRRSVTR